MACLRFATSITSACRDAQPGVVELFIADFSDLVSFTTNTAGDTLSGLTCSGVTGLQKVFYTIKLNKQVGSFIDSPTINLQNGVAVSKPKVSFAIQGLTTTTIGLYRQLLQADVAIVAKTINGSLYAIGFNNGLSMSAGGMGTEAAVDGKIGLTTIEIDGIEPTPFYLVDPDLNFETNFVI